MGRKCPARRGKDDKASSVTQAPGLTPSPPRLGAGPGRACLVHSSEQSSALQVSTDTGWFLVLFFNLTFQNCCHIVVISVY